MGVVWHTERDRNTGMPLRATPVPTLTVPEQQAELDRVWRQHQQEAKAHQAAEAEALQRKLDIATTEVFERLAKAIGHVSTPEGWTGLVEEIEALVDAKGLSGRYGRELTDRLVRIGTARRW